MEHVWRVGQWCRGQVSQCEESGAVRGRVVQWEEEEEAVGHVLTLFHPPK